MSFAAAVDSKWVTAGPWRQFGNWYLPPQSFSPLMLNPYAWYDAHTGGSSSGITDSSLNGRAPMTVGAGSNSPVWLPYTAPSVYLPGVAGNYISCPDSNSLDVTGDIELVTRMSFRSASAGAYQVIAKRASDVAVSFRWQFNFGTPILLISSDGTSEAGVAASASTPIADGSYGWYKVTRRQSDGRVQFFTATDQSVEPSSWTQLGADQVLAAGAATFASTSVLEIGSREVGTLEPFDGSISRAIMRNGIGGTVVADFDASLCTQTGCTGPLGNVWAVTRNGTGRKTVVQSSVANSAESLFLLGTDDWLDVPAAAIPPLDTFAAPSSVVAVFRRWHNPGTAGHAIFTTKASLGNSLIGVSMRLITTAGNANLVNAAGDGAASDFTNYASTALGLRSVAGMVVGNSSPYMRSFNNSDAVIDDTSRGTTATTNAAVAGRVGAYLGGTAPIDMEFRALLTFNRELTANEFAQLVAYYRGGL